MANEKRILMVKGSKWRFTQDATLTRTQTNSKFDDEERKWWDTNRAKVYGPNSTMDYAEATKTAKQFVSKVLGIPETLEVEWGEAKAGVEFEITGKSTNSVYSSDYRSKFLGLHFPIKIDDRTIWAPYKAIEPIIELAGEAPTVNEYVIRARDSGKIYAGINYDRPTIWSNALQTHVANPDYDPDNIIKYADTFMKGKRWKDAGKPKLAILDFTGYYEDLPYGGGRPDWMGDGTKQFDLPKDWEIVKFDKLTKKELEVIDVQEWFKRTWELRALTIQFGSPVRTLYNDLDKKGKLDNFKGMLVVRAPVETRHAGTNYAYTSYTDELDPKDVAELDQLIEQFGFKSKDLKRAKDDTCVAVAFANTNAALRLKLSYSGKLQFNILDLETLKEAVADE